MQSEVQQVEIIGVWDCSSRKNGAMGTQSACFVVVGHRILELGRSMREAALLSGKIFHSKPESDSTLYLPETGADEEYATRRGAYRNEMKKPLDHPRSPEILREKTRSESVWISTFRPIG
jgi:hypothetical protein